MIGRNGSVLFIKPDKGESWLVRYHESTHVENQYSSHTTLSPKVAEVCDCYVHAEDEEHQSHHIELEGQEQLVFYPGADHEWQFFGPRSETRDGPEGVKEFLLCAEPD